MAWLWKVITTVCLALVSHRVIKLVIVSGFFKPAYNHTPGPCELVRGVENGSEDIHTLSNGVALISSGLMTPGGIDEDDKGQILTFDFHNPSAGALKVALQGFDNKKLNPVGLSVYEERRTGTITVFIINRRTWLTLPSAAVVEVFDFKVEDKLLIHKKTIQHSNIYTPNNIIATSPTTFYLTNDGYSDSIPIRIVELLLTLPSGSVVYYDGKEAVKVIPNILTPNGIAISHTRKHLYVSSTLAQEIEIYEIQENGAVSFVKSIHLATLVDNLNVDPDTGDIWAGCISSPSHAGAQVLRVSLDEELNAEIREALSDDGRILEGSSVASMYKRKLLVGSVQKKMLFCQLQAF